MVGCELHVRGYEFDVDGFLSTSQLQPYWIHHKGESSGNGQVWGYSGLSFHIAKSEVEKLPEQLACATAFFERNGAEIARLDSYGGDVRRISFCVTPDDTLSKNHVFPHEFLALAVTQRLSIQLSESVVK